MSNDRAAAHGDSACGRGVGVASATLVGDLNGTRLKLILHRSDGRERIFNPPCDRQGRWIQNIVVSRTPHDVRAEIYGGQAMGYTSVYEGH